MTSNTKRSAASRRVWGAIREVSGADDGLDLRNSSLGDRYEVNKFGIDAEHDSLVALEEIYERMVAYLGLQGWTIIRERDRTVLVNPAEVRVYVGKPFSLDNFGRPGGGKFTVSIQM